MIFFAACEINGKTPKSEIPRENALKSEKNNYFHQSPYITDFKCLEKHALKKFKKSCENIWWFNKNAILLSFGEVAEWSIAAVLKTVELRGSGGSNPSLSALNSLQGVDFQPCRLFYAQKVAPKMHRPRFYTPLRAFFKLHISHTSYPIFSFRLTARNAWCNFSPLPVKKMHEKREPPL